MHLYHGFFILTLLAMTGKSEGPVGSVVHGFIVTMLAACTVITYWMI
jgi:hypothetical protein